MIKLLFIGILFLFLGGYTCSRKEKTVVMASLVADTTKIETSKKTVSFDAEIKPIFVNHCQPCHFPGGKMYEKMPFDKAQTIIDHEAGILRRIKDPMEVEKLKAFLTQKEN